MNATRRGLAPLLLLALGCGPSASQWQYAPGARDPGYDSALTTWTRSAETYEYFESRVFARATWFSPAFAAAWARYRAQRLGLSPSEADAQFERALAAARDEARFFVAIATHDPYWNDMHRADGTLEPTLRIGNSAQHPVEVDRLSENEMADLRPFFPYAGPLHTGYWVVFEQPEQRNRLQLRIAGPPAIIDLVWNTK